MIDAEKVISELKYKPGWAWGFQAFDPDKKSFVSRSPGLLVITMAVLDSRNLDKTVFFTFKRVIPSWAAETEDTFLEWWKETVILEAEYHEIREFARYKGELIDDPHKAEVAEPQG